MIGDSFEATPSESNSLEPEQPFSLGLSTRFIQSGKTFLPSVSSMKEFFCWSEKALRAEMMGLTSLEEFSLSTTRVYLPPGIRFGPIWATALRNAVSEHVAIFKSFILGADSHQ